MAFAQWLHRRSHLGEATTCPAGHEWRLGDLHVLGRQNKASQGAPFSLLFGFSASFFLPFVIENLSETDLL